MNKRNPVLSFIFVGLLFAFLTACGGRAFEETFDDAGSWGVGSEQDVRGAVTGGVYDMAVESSNGIFWSTAGQALADGSYTVEATQIDGPIDNGYGMIFMADMEADNFYVFEVSGDGFVWIGLCEAACQGDITNLVNSDWFESSAVRQGLNDTNTLRVDVNQGNMTFFVNGQEVGRGFDDTLTNGDVGILVETIGAGGVRVQFDNFSFTPAE